MAPAQNLRAAGDRIEQLLAELEKTADPSTYRSAVEALRLVTELYGGGLSRVMELANEQAPALVGALVGDELVGSLLLVHELHPVDVKGRVEQALAEVRPLLARHGGDVELVDLDLAAAAVRIRLLGSCDGCPSSSVTLQLAVEKGIREAAPEIIIIDVDQPGQDVPVALGAKPAYDECPSEMADR